MKQYKYLLFDLDGTITDSFDSVANSYIYALSFFGINIEDKSRLRSAMGPPLKDYFMDSFGFSPCDADEAVKKYRERYTVYNTIENKLYPDIKTVLEGLKCEGFKLILATSKPEDFAVKILKHFDIFDCFHDVCGASFDESRSEKEDVLKYLIEKNNITDSKEAVMIGDRKYDLEAAATLGIDAIGVLYGYGDIEELSSYPNVFLAPTAKMLYNYLIN